MAYFQYDFSTHLSRPATVTNNLLYNGQYSNLASPFDGETINLNFYNLGAFSNDATIRLGILEGLAQTGYSVTPGYVSYSGRQETEGSFYSGIPLVINPTGSPINSGYAFSTGLAFQVAVGDGIVTLANGSVDTVNSKYGSITYPASGTTYVSVPVLTDYLNSRLAYNSLSTTYGTFQLIGQAAPASVGQVTWTNTWGSLSTTPKSFWVYVNDQKTINAGTKVTIGTSFAWGTPLSTIATSLTSAINSAVGAVTTIAVTTDGTFLALTPTNDRLNNGCYEIRIERVSGDTSSILDWMGWLANTSSNFTELWDYRSIFTFVANSASFPVGYSIQGQGPFTTMVFKMQDPTVTIPDFLTAFSLAPPIIPGVTSYHTRLPLTSYTNKPLNYGGSLTVNNLGVNGNLNLLGSLTVVGSATYTTMSLTTATVSNTLTVGGNAHVAQLEGHLIPGYLSNPAFDLDGASGVAPQTWLLKMSTTPANPPINTSITVANGIPNVGTTFLTNNLSPLVGSYDAIYTKAGVNQQGVFVYNPFTIDLGLTNQWLQIKFPYKVASAFYASGDMGVYVLDVNSGTLITPSVTALPATSTNPAVFTTYFKATANTLYWLVFYTLTTNVNSYAMEVGGISVSDLLTVNPIIRGEFTLSTGTLPATGNPIVFDTTLENVGGGVLTSGRYTPPLPGVYAVTFSGISVTALSAMTAGTTNLRFDLRRATTVQCPIAGRIFDVASATPGPISGHQIVRVSSTTDILDILYTITGAMTGTPVLSVSAGQLGRFTVQWLGF